MPDDFLQEPKIVAWKKSLTDNGCTINKIEPLNIYVRPKGELLFALLKADITGPDGYKIPPVIFLRGHACIIVPLLINKETGEQRFLMVLQRRIATGALTLEFPAGMLDREIKYPARIAVKELNEETGLDISEDWLFSLFEGPLYTSPGASDEGIYYYGCEIELDNTEYRSFEGRIRGEDAENEYIRVTLKTKEEAKKQITTLPARLGLSLFEEYYSQNNGKKCN